MEIVLASTLKNHTFSFSTFDVSYVSKEKLASLVKRSICLPCSFCKYMFGPRSSVVFTELYHNCFVSFTAWITFKLIFWLAMLIKHKFVVTFYLNIRKLLTKIQNNSGRKVERTYSYPSGPQSQCKANLCLFIQGF